MLESVVHFKEIVNVWHIIFCQDKAFPSLNGNKCSLLCSADDFPYFSFSFSLMLNGALHVVNEKPNILLSQWKWELLFLSMFIWVTFKSFNFLPSLVMFLQSFLTQGTCRSSNYLLCWLNDLLHKLNRHCTGGKFLSDGRIILRTESNVSSALESKQMPHFPFSECQSTENNDQMFHTIAISLWERHFQPNNLEHLKICHYVFQVMWKKFLKWISWEAPYDLKFEFQNQEQSI